MMETVVPLPDDGEIVDMSTQVGVGIGSTGGWSPPIGYQSPPILTTSAGPYIIIVCIFIVWGIIELIRWYRGNRCKQV